MAKTRRNRLEVVKLNSVVELDDDRLEKLYVWVDAIPLSRPKKSMTRDFSDGVMVAEVIKYFTPKLVELHNYTPSNGARQKENNWYVLNRKVMPKLHLEIHPDTITAIVQGKPWVIENVLLTLRERIDFHLADKHGIGPMDEMKWGSNASLDGDQPEADQGTDKAFIPVEQFYVPSTGSTSQRTSQPHALDAEKLSSLGKPKAGPYGVKRTPRAPGEMVSKAILNQREQELSQRQETIEILQGKIQRLEHLLHLKDIRIEDLSGRVDDLESQYNRPTAKHSNSYQIQHKVAKPAISGREVGQNSYRR